MSASKSRNSAMTLTICPLKLKHWYLRYEFASKRTARNREICNIRTYHHDHHTPRRRHLNPDFWYRQDRVLPHVHPPWLYLRMNISVPGSYISADAPRRKHKQKFAAPTSTRNTREFPNTLTESPSLHLRNGIRELGIRSSMCLLGSGCRKGGEAGR